MAIRREEWTASLIAAAGVIWVVQSVTSTPLPAYGMVLSVGPLETCGAAILVWLHAKWRRVRFTNGHRDCVSAFLPAN